MIMVVTQKNSRAGCHGLFKNLWPLHLLEHHRTNVFTQKFAQQMYDKMPLSPGSTSIKRAFVKLCLWLCHLTMANQSCNSLAASHRHTETMEAANYRTGAVWIMSALEVCQWMVTRKLWENQGVAVQDATVLSLFISLLQFKLWQTILEDTRDCSPNHLSLLYYVCAQAADSKVLPQPSKQKQSEREREIYIYIYIMNG